MLLLIDPSDDLRRCYDKDPRVAFYSEKSIFIWDSELNARANRPVAYPASIESYIDMAVLDAKIAWWQPIWCRWLGAAEEYEIYRRSAKLFAVALAQMFIKFNVRDAVFFTSISHHIEYSLLETACQLAGVRQIYLYSTVFGSNARLLPLGQMQSIVDREQLGLGVSDVDLQPDIERFKKNYVNRKPPEHNEQQDPLVSSYAYARIQVVKRSVRQSVKRLISSGRTTHFIDNYSDYDGLGLLNIIHKQREALKYYASLARSGDHVDAVLTQHARLPIIYAHYQPEATSFPEGGRYSNHVDIIISIRQKGYTGPILYKEHPVSWIYFSKITGVSRVGLYRTVEYFKQLEALGCIFVQPSFRLLERHQKSLFPVTITGSIAIERSLVGLVTCCVGEPWYKGMPGVVDLAAFANGGVFFDSDKWCFDGDMASRWLTKSLAKKTINNSIGIGTGVVSTSSSDRREFAKEFDSLVRQLIGT
jgi:hypothetical protein